MRMARRVEVQDDYLSLIADMISAHGEARSTDLAARLGVTPATVANTLARLKRDGLVEARPYRSILLTPQGRALAAKSRTRYKVLVEFLTTLGISNDIAETDAEGLQHHLSDTALAAMRAFAATSADCES